MNGRIRILDGAIVDQIAAGEVVERPASVVKELVENALDAGAAAIDVEIEGGGLARIRVTDDGSGMTPADARLAVERHATSKIAVLDDLSRIATMGFRGEALPSIASVSRFALVTRARDAIAATRVTIDGGLKPTVRETGAAPGTTVEVRELFYNVPARRKFLKAAATESAHVGDVVLRAALGDPNVRITLVRDGKRSRELLPAKDRATRARAVLGGATLSTLEGQRDGVRVEAHLGAPERARTGAGGLHIFVNRRPVRDRALARAVAFAYGSVLPPGRYPSGVVYLDVDPEIVDVNVHPQKLEVRFADARLVLDAVTRALSSGLGTSAWSGPATRGASWWNERLGGSSAARHDAPVGSTPLAGVVEPTPDDWGLAAAMRESRPDYVPAASSGNGAGRPDALGPPTGLFGSLRVIGQVRRMLIVCEGEDSLYVLDQHAADERLKYHRLRATYRAKDVAVQRLLFPERVELGTIETATLDERRDDLLAVGLDCTAVGPTTIAVHAVPAIVSRATPERLLRDVLDELTREGDRAFGDRVDTALATMACHAAIRAGDSLSLEECSALVRALDQVDDFAGHCPHGRPIAHTIPFAEVERKLGR